MAEALPDYVCYGRNSPKDDGALRASDKGRADDKTGSSALDPVPLISSARQTSSLPSILQSTDGRQPQLQRAARAPGRLLPARSHLWRPHERRRLCLSSPGKPCSHRSEPICPWSEPLCYRPARSTSSLPGNPGECSFRSGTKPIASQGEAHKGAQNPLNAGGALVLEAERVIAEARLRWSSHQTNGLYLNIVNSLEGVRNQLRHELGFPFVSARAICGVVSLLAGGDGIRRN
jgi:hypothetical protein